MEDQLRFCPVDIGTWDDFAVLFEERGGPKSCWCMVWRASTEEARRRDGTSRRLQIYGRVEGHVPIGLLGYLNDRPVAWCSIAPKGTYRRLGGPEAKVNERVWSLACMFVKREFRKMGFVSQIIEAAIAHAAENGANIVEAYPVDRDSPSFRFMGFVETFAAAGLRRLGEKGNDGT